MLATVSSESSVVHLIAKDVMINMEKTIIWPVVLYGYETRSFALREKDTEGVWEQVAEEWEWAARLLQELYDE
jgi:hypothetical protein